MSFSTGSMIAASARISLAYNERLTADIPAAQFATMVKNGDVVIDANHPAFLLGHLSIYAHNIIDDLGGDSSAVKPTDHYQELFSHKSTCVNDPDATIYPGKDELIERVTAAYTAAIEALEAAPNEAFAVPNPNESMRDKFASAGAMHGFYVGGHFMMHMGQLSTWRRMMGLGPA